MKKLLVLGACFSIGSPACLGGQSGGGPMGPSISETCFEPTSEVYEQFLGRYSSAYALSLTDNASCGAEAVGTVTVEVSRRNAANADSGGQPDAGRAHNGDADASTPPPFEPPCGAEWAPVTLDVTLTPTPTEQNDEPVAQSYSFPALLNEEGTLHWDREDVPEQLPELQQAASGFLHPEQGSVRIGGETLWTIRACCLEQPTQEVSYARVKARGVVKWELEACAAGKPEELELQFEVERSGPSNPCLASELPGRIGREQVSVHVFNSDGDLLLTLPGEARGEDSPLLRVDAKKRTEGLDGLGTAADDQIEQFGVVIEFDPNDADMEPSIALNLYFGFPSAEPPCLTSLDEKRAN